MSTEPAPSTSDPRAVLDALADLVFVIDGEGLVRYANAAAHRFLGGPDAEHRGRSVLDFVHPDDLAVVLSSLESVHGKDHGTPVEVRVADPDHGWRWIEVIGSSRMDDPDLQGVVVVGRDITQRRMWEVAGGDMVRFQQVMQHAAAITLLLDTHGTVTSVNGAFTRLLGHDPSVVVGRDLASFSTFEDEAAFRRLLDHVVVTGMTGSVEVHMRCARPTQEPRPVRFEVVNLLDDPIVSGLVVTGFDISELHTARQELEYLARHDGLTGLPNRALLLDRLERLLALRKPLAVIFVDLDHFKPVNDELGHEAGDELLQLVAERMRRSARPDDLVARMGGDEFVVVAPGISSRADAARIANRLEEAISEPYRLRAGSATISASIGFAVSVPESTVNELLAAADFSMYDAKADRRGVVRHGAPRATTPPAGVQCAP